MLCLVVPGAKQAQENLAGFRQPRGFPD